MLKDFSQFSIFLVLKFTRVLLIMACCCERKWLLAVLVLLKRERRHGYASRGRSHWLKLLMLYTLHQSQHGDTASDRTKKKRRWWVRPIFADHDKYGAWATLIPVLRETDEDLYFNFMRMTPAAFDRLLKLVSPFISKVSWRKAISPGERLAITLRYLASGDSHMSLSYLFRVSNQAISKIVLETTTVIWHVLKKIVLPNMNEREWLRVAAEFQVMWNLPHCVGAIDGKQVPIRAFPHSGSRWFGYKKRHCMTLMAVSDAKSRFIIVESGASGKRGDANIFYKSSLAQRLRTKKLNLPPPCPVEGIKGNLPFFFVGDNAYGQSGNFATPFKGDKLRDEEMVYNYRLSRARRIVENAFGILCARFRIMFTSIQGSASLVRSIILACLALHNYHLLDEESIPPKNRKYKPHGYSDHVTADGRYVYGRWRNENCPAEHSVLKKMTSQIAVARGAKRVDVGGDELAEMLIRYFVYKPVSWQWEKSNLLL